MLFAIRETEAMTAIIGHCLQMLCSIPTTPPHFPSAAHTLAAWKTVKHCTMHSDFEHLPACARKWALLSLGHYKEPHTPHLPSTVLKAKAFPFDQHFPSRPCAALSARQKPLWCCPLCPKRVHRACAKVAFEVDQLALRDLGQGGLRHPLVVEVGAVGILHKVLRLIVATCATIRPLGICGQQEQWPNL